MHFAIVPADATPIYRQIVDQVRRRIASGAWLPGDELPSVRAVALEHAINPMTVSKAYSLLEAQGLLERRRGLGMAVASSAVAGGARARRERQALLSPALAAAAAQAQELGVTPAEALAWFEAALKAAKDGGA